MFSNNTHFRLLLFFSLESHQKAGLAFAEKQYDFTRVQVFWFPLDEFKGIPMIWRIHICKMIINMIQTQIKQKIK